MQNFTIAPVGTCRIHTPLRRGATRHPYDVTLNRNYGFVHTSREVIQQLDVLCGGPPVEEPLRPLVYRPNTTDAFFEKRAVPADFYFIEISSSKHVSLDNAPIQLNYAIRYFGDFFADRQTARRFWSLGKEEQAAERLEWLKGHRQFQKLNKPDQELLAHIRVRELTEADIARDIAEVVERVGRDKAVIVTHVNAHTPDDLPIASRKRLIDAVHKGAAAVEAQLYDPTPAMLKFGQIRAMENDGLDLTHFTLPFADTLADEWFSAFVAPHVTVDDGVQGVAETTADERAVDIGSLRALLDDGRIAEASSGVRAAIRTGKYPPDCHRLLGLIQHQLGDYEGAIENLEFVRGEHGATEEDDALLLQSYYSLGNHTAALAYGGSLMSDERETPEILRTSAKSAEALGDEGRALTYWKRLFQREADDAAASAVLAILEKRGDDAEVVDWADQVLQHLPEHVGSVLAKWAVGVRQRSIGYLLQVASHSRRLDDATALRLAQESIAAGLASPAAALIAPRVAYIKSDPAIVGWVSEQATKWRERGLEALEQRDLAAATDLIQASYRVTPDQGASIRAKRALEQTLRREVRQAFLAKDHARVMELTDVAIDTATDFPEIDSFVGRAAAELGDLDRALLHLKKAAEADPSSAPQIQLARVAVQASDYLEALRAYNAVVSDSNALDWARDEASRKLVKLLSPAIRASRESIEAGRVDYAWALLDEAGRYAQNAERVRRERDRIYRQLRKELKAVDATDIALRHAAAEIVLRIAPEDPVALRIGASSAMRLHRFKEARAMWDSLLRVGGDDPKIRSAIAKCDLWIARAKSKKAA